MDFIQSIILGVVEGVTEFLPVSSTGHLIVVNRFINFTGPFAELFDIVIQLGAILAVVALFWKRLWPVFELGSIWRPRTIWLKTLAGALPALLVGGVLGHRIKESLFNPGVVAGALVAGGGILLAVERWKKESHLDDPVSFSYRMVVAIGFIQCLAMVPGTSRSAATIIGAMLLGATRQAAAEYSFFLAIPTMVAASAYSFMKYGGVMTGRQGLVLVVGFIVSFLTAWAVVALFINYLRRNSLAPFGWYRIALGLVLLALLFRHIL